MDCPPLLSAGLNPHLNHGAAVGKEIWEPLQIWEISRIYPRFVFPMKATADWRLVLALRYIHSLPRHSLYVWYVCTMYNGTVHTYVGVFGLAPVEGYSALFLVLLVF